MIMFAGILGSIGIKLAILGVVALAIGGFYLHYLSVKSDRDAALAQVGALQVASKVQKKTIKNQEKAIENWAKAQKQMQQTLNELARNQVAATKTIRRLNDVLAKHDLHALSLAKPGLIERRINRGTSGINRMFEQATGGSDSRRDADKTAKPKAGAPQPASRQPIAFRLEGAHPQAFAKGRPVGVLCLNPKGVRNSGQEHGRTSPLGEGSQVAARLLSRKGKTGWIREQQSCTRRWQGLTNAPVISLTALKSMPRLWPRTKNVIVKITKKFTLESLMSIRGFLRSREYKTGCSGLELPGCSR